MWETFLAVSDGMQLFSVSSVVTVAIFYIGFFIAILIDCWRFKGDFIPFPSESKDRKRLALMAWVLFVCVLAATLTYQ